MLAAGRLSTAEVIIWMALGLVSSWFAIAPIRGSGSLAFRMAPMATILSPVAALVTTVLLFVAIDVEPAHQLHIAAHRLHVGPRDSYPFWARAWLWLLPGCSLSIVASMLLLLARPSRSPRIFSGHAYAVSFNMISIIFLISNAPV